MSADELRAEIRRLGPWHHDVEVVPGVRTGDRASRGTHPDELAKPSVIRPDEVLTHFVEHLYPDGFAGRSVLDCACNAAAFCSPPHAVVGVALIVADELDAAEPAVDDALTEARRLGNAQAFATAAHLRAWIHFRRGRLPETAADAEMVLDAARYGWEPALPAAHALLAMCLLERGEIAAAEAALELPGGEVRWHSTFTWNDYLDARGQVRLAAGDAQAALDDFSSAGEALTTLGAPHCSIVPWRRGAAMASAALGRLDEAHRLAAEDIELARAYGAPRALGLTLRTAGNLAGGDRGIELLREAVDVLAASPARLEHAHARSDLGAALVAAGHRVAAREPLKEALDGAHSCGATALGERVRELLTRAGSRPRRAALAWARRADPARAAAGRDGGGGQDQPRNRGAAVHHDEDRRDPPAPRLRQARNQLAA